jgi:hypothetical protein
MALGIKGKGVMVISANKGNDILDSVTSQC